MLPVSVVEREFNMFNVGHCWEGCMFKDPSITG